MKKVILLTLTLLTISLTSQAQFFIETWDTPAAWTTNDADGDGNDWNLQDVTGVGSIGSLGNVAYSESWNSFPLTPDNYLMSPAFDFSTMTGNITLQFDVASVDPNFQLEYYDVYVVTDLTTLGTTAVPIFGETIMVGNQIFTHSFDISSFAGQAQVFIVFEHHNVTNMYQLLVDNIIIANSSYSAVAVTACAATVDYTFTDNSVGATSWFWDFGASAVPPNAVGAGPHTVTFNVAGVQTVFLTTDGISSQTTMIDLAADSTFSYSQPSYCFASPDETATVTGVSGGTFSSTTPGFVVDMNTGQIALSTFAVGTYDVTYTTPASICQNSGTLQIDIVAPPTVNDPGDQTVCEGASTADILFTGTGGGTYDWTYTNGTATNIGIPFSGTGDILSFVAANGTGAQVVSTFDVTPTTGSCSGSVVQFTITVDPAEDPTFSYSSASYCVGSANQVPNVIMSAGGTFSSTVPGFIADMNTGEINISTFPVGSYDVTYTTAMPCPSSTTIQVDIISDDATFAYSNTAYCLGSADEIPVSIATLGGTFSSTTPGFVVDVNTGQVALSTFPVATYDVTYTTNAACPASSTIQLDIVAPPTVNDPGDQSVCEGLVTADILFTGMGGGTYDWTYTNGTATNIGLPFSGTGDILSFVTANGTGAAIVSTFDVTPSLGACAGAVVQFTITVNPTEVAAFSYSQAAYCLGSPDEAAVITGTGGGTFSSPTPGFVLDVNTGNIALSTSPVGTYDVTYTTSGACPAASTIQVDIVTPPSVNNPGNQTLCEGQSTADILFTGVGGGTYNWTYTNGTATNIGVPFSGTGDILSFVATNGTGAQVVSTFDVVPTLSGCNGATVQFTITIDPLDDPTFAYSQASYCFTEPNPTPVITTSNGTFSSVPAGLTLDPLTGTIDLSTSTANTYDITYTTAGACPQSLTVTISVGAGPSVNPISNQQACEGNATVDVVFSGSPGTVFDWTNSDPTIGIAASGTGDILSFTALNGTGAQLVATIDVTPSIGTCIGTPTSYTYTVDPAEDATFTLQASACSSDPNPTATLDPAATTGGTFSSLPAGLSINAASGLINLTTSVAGSYTVTYTSPGVCTATVSLPFDLFAKPVVNPMINDTVCHGQNFPLVNFTSSSNPVFNWINNNASTGLVALSGTGDIASFTGSNPLGGNPPRVSNIKVYGVENGCTSDTVYFDLQVNSNPSVSAGADLTVCEGTPITMSGTGTASSYTWNSGITNGVAFTPVAGSYIYTVTGTTSGCSASDQANVTVNPAPTVSAGLDKIVCAGDSTALIGSGTAVAYFWDNGAIDNDVFTPFFSINYVVTGLSANGCTATDTMMLTVESLPIPSFTSDIASGCGPLVVIFNSSPTTNSCVYSFGDGTINVAGCNNVAHTYNTAGSYDVTLIQTSVNFCIGATTVPGMITVNPDPVASFVPVTPGLTMIDPSTSFINTSTGATTYEWSFGDLAMSTDFEPAHTFPGDQADDFTVQLISTSVFGCTDTATAIVTVEESLLFYIPNSFSPNGDEFNNKFEPMFFSGIDPQDFSMKIYNRFGELIFETFNAAEGWDGDYGPGTGLVEAGVYTYKLEFSTVNRDEKKLIVGYVNVIR